jgi:hypothetical protein
MEGNRCHEISLSNQLQAQRLPEPVVHYRQHVLPAAVFEALDGLARGPLFFIEDRSPGSGKRGRISLARATEVVSPFPGRENPATGGTQGTGHPSDSFLTLRTYCYFRFLPYHCFTEDAEPGKKEFQER